MDELFDNLFISDKKKNTRKINNCLGNERWLLIILFAGCFGYYTVHLLVSVTFDLKNTS